MATKTTAASILIVGVVAALISSGCSRSPQNISPQQKQAEIQYVESSKTMPAAEKKRILLRLGVPTH